jgi:hypothetical protein
MTRLALPYGNGEHVVEIPFRADVSPRFRPGGADEEMLHRALQVVTVRDVTDSCILSCEDLGCTTPVVVVKNSDYPELSVRFGIHAGHMAAHPGVSPFIILAMPRPTTDTLVLDFQEGMLVRVMPGHEYPPLPWMKSARGRVSECAAYWHGHSYVKTKVNVQGGLSNQKPQWW